MATKPGLSCRKTSPEMFVDANAALTFRYGSPSFETTWTDRHCGAPAAAQLFGLRVFLDQFVLVALALLPRCLLA
jgi:hypothetical protein